MAHMSENTNNQYEEKKIDLFVLSVTMWKYKLTLISITFVAAVLSVLFALAQPNSYQASVLLAPVDDGTNQQLAGLAQTIGAFTGSGSVEQSVSQVEVSLRTMNSRKFVLDFIKRHDLKVPMVTIESWDKDSNTINYNDDAYDREAKQWLGNSKSGPSDWVIYENFKNRLLIETEPTSGFITVSLTSPVPELSSQWLTLLIHDINEHLRQEEINNTRSRVGYLHQQLEKTNVMGIRNIFFQLIEEEEKRALLAETSEEFILRTIDPAAAPEMKIAPRRAVIAIIGTLLGGLLSLLVVYLREVSPYIKRRWSNTAQKQT